MVSIDCFVEDFKLNMVGSSEYLFRGFLTIFLPLLFFLVFAFMYGVWKLIRRDRHEYKRALVVIAITIVYFFYPTLTNRSLNLFKCMGIEGTLRLELDLELECWKGAHLYWAMFMGLPLMIFWVIGLPVLGIVFLLLNRKKVFTPGFDHYFLVLYQGLEK